MSLNEIESVTKLHKVTLHEHLSKLVETGFVNKIEREGHKWVYYKLSWKGDSLIHPENTNVVILFGITIITLLFGIIGLINIVQNIISFGISKTTTKGPNPDINPSNGLLFGIDPVILFITIICLILFTIFMIISLRRYKKNKIPKI